MSASTPLHKNVILSVPSESLGPLILGFPPIQIPSSYPLLQAIYRVEDTQGSRAETVTVTVRIRVYSDNESESYSEGESRVRVTVREELE